MVSVPVNFLLEDPISAVESQRLLSEAGFKDTRSAYRSLLHIARQPGAYQALIDCLPQLLVQLQACPSPDSVLINLERLAGAASNPGDLFQFMAGDPRTIEILVMIFSSSQFLTEILLRNPGYVEELAGQVRQAEVKSAENYKQEAWKAAESVNETNGALDSLRRYQRQQLLRIGACDLAARFDLVAVTGQLSSLADGLVQACLRFSAEPLHLPVNTKGVVSGICVLAMGKLGGRELNYSSDIDLLFLSSSDEAVYTRLGERLIEGLAGVTDEGFLYRVDMRLRPWGRAGALTHTVEGALSYLRQAAKLWEKQALLKARSIAGDRSIGDEFLHQAAQIIYNYDPDTIRTEVFGMKQRTETYLRQQGRSWGEVKLGEGSIRDIEFVVQYLQLVYGKRQPEIRSRNTLRAIQRLVHYGYLPLEDSRTLTGGYAFLRTTEHHLQMMHYRQTYTLPKDPSALANLSRRLGFQGENAGEEFVARYQQHSVAVRSIFLKYLGERIMDAPEKPVRSAPEVQRHLERMDPSYEATFSRQDISRHAALAEQLDSEHLVEVDAIPLEDGHWRVTIIAYDYPGELSLICGLMFLYGLEIKDGNVFTYEPVNGQQTSPASRPVPRKIVDVFTVYPPEGEIGGEAWARYADDLTGLLRLMQAGQRQEARVQMAKWAAEALNRIKGEATPLYPIEIEIDNELSERYTVLRISARDTPGFLYELTNALAFNRIYIARVEIETIRTKANDTLFVTDGDGRKISSATKQRELRAATVLIKHFTHLLPLSPDPESALLHFHAFIGELFRRPDWPDELASLEKPEVLGALAQVLGVSDFLWDDFLRMQHASLFPVVKDVGALATAKPKDLLQSELFENLAAAQLQPGEADGWVEALNTFKDREMFRIDMRHILGYTQEFWDFAQELTDLTEIVVRGAFHSVYDDLIKVHGVPMMEDGTISSMSVCALGKCGGRELGFASDIELMFIYAGNGKTEGPNIITTAEFYEALVEHFMRAIRSRREGIFEIDLQLRPYGRAGSLSVSMEAFRRYFAPEGPAWPYERQALVRLRPIAGDAALGEKVEAMRDRFVYSGAGFDITAMRAMRERQIRHLVKGGTFNPKYSPGGLVDLEYLVQGLQIQFGANDPSLRSTNIREGMTALAEAGVLTGEDYIRLRKAYTFLRWLIDSLRVVEGNAKDLVVPPEDSEEFAYLARRLRYGGDRTKLREEILAYTADVQEVNRRMLKA